MKKRWHFILIFVLFCFFAYFIFSIADNYYARNKNPKKVIEINSKENKLESSGDNATNTSLNDSEPEETEEIIQPNSFKIKVGQSDCDNECARFKDDDELEYCERICGISDLYDYGDEEESGEDSEELPDCSKKVGIKKDYCLKDLAVEESDFKICNQIIDTAIQKSCNNRIMEDLIEEE